MRVRVDNDAGGVCRCWTCRARKVKCDERLRNGCGVCERVGLACAGYGVSLCWNPGQRRNEAGIQRRCIRLDRASSLARPEREIDRMLSILDVISPDDLVMMGPFAVFRTQVLQDNAISREVFTGMDEQRQMSSISFKSPEPDHARGQVCRRRQTSPLGELVSPSSAISLPLFQDSETALLMFHYKDHVAGLLQPVAHPKNPWRTTYFPFALEGRPDLFLTQSPASASKASTAIFHGLLSSAAFHLRNLNHGLERFHRLGLRHRTKSLQALNTALAGPKDSQMYTVQLTAMLSLVTIDTMTGEDSDFPIHLQGCWQLRRYHDANSPASSSRQVNSICHFLSLLARTTSGIAGAHSSPTVWLPEGPLFCNEDRDIEYIYGITPTLGNLLHRTCQLSESVDRCRGEPSIQIRQARNKLREDLLKWDLTSEQFQRVGEDTAMLDIIHCQARAFHSAVLILYYRAVEMYRCIDPEEEAHRVWMNLKLAEVKKENGERKVHAAPMSWPAFIAACEARDREPWIEWWEGVQGYNLGNFRRQWRVIREVWTKVDEQGAGLSWRDALRELGTLVLPV
ncbi:hypothetical protein N7512_001722 [Penicillium capsulatum]|nr:hypothetical protein N7512_001722 [Penicillium capsulatum]